MCRPEYQEHDCLCKKICMATRLILAGAVLGTIAGMVGMYFFDHDKRFQKNVQRNASRMLEGAEELTHNIKTKIYSTDI